MALREIRILGDEVLREPAAPVETFDEGLRALVDDMWETMYHADGIGLAAPQIGISKRLIVVHPRQSDERAEGEEAHEPLALVNPRVVDSSVETDKEIEGCLSIPGVEEYVERFLDVRVEAQDLDGSPFEVEAGGLLGRALQHEIDHLDGILFIDRISPLKRRLLMKKWRKALAER